MNSDETSKSRKKSSMKKIVILLVLFLITPLVGCSAEDEFENLQMNTDYDSVKMMTESFDTKKTVTKMLVTLRNTGKEAIYVDGKFIFSVIKVENQGEKSRKFQFDDDAITTTPAQEIGWLSSSSWSSVNSVFQVIEPYTEKEFVVAIKLPNNTYIESLELVNRADSDTKRLGFTRFGFCPFEEGATVSDWAIGKSCKSGKLI